MHELEFLSLLAFLSREAISLRGISTSKAKKFTPNDREMAYAFHNRFGTGAVPNQPPPMLGGGGSNLEGYQKPTASPRQHYRLDTSPQHAYMSGRPTEQQDAGFTHIQLGQSGFHGQAMARDYAGHGESREWHLQQQQQQSARYSGQGGPVGQVGPTGHSQQDRDDQQRMSFLLAGANERQPHYHSPQPPQGLMMSSPERGQMQLYPQDRQPRPQPRPPQGELLNTSRTSGKLRL